MHAWRSLDLAPQTHVPETFVVAVTTALTTRTFGRVVANLGWHDVQLPVPVSVGDTIEAESTILETREVPLTAGRGYCLGGDASAQSARCRGAVLSPNAAGVPARCQRAVRAGGLLMLMGFAPLYPSYAQLHVAL